MYMFMKLINHEITIVLLVSYSHLNFTETRSRWHVWYCWKLALEDTRGFRILYACVSKSSSLQTKESNMAEWTRVNFTNVELCKYITMDIRIYLVDNWVIITVFNFVSCYVYTVSVWTLESLDLNASGYRLWSEINSHRRWRIYK